MLQVTAVVNEFCVSGWRDESRRPAHWPANLTRRGIGDSQKFTRQDTGQFVDLNGIKVHYSEMGQGPALSCFHGGGPSANAWDKHQAASAGLPGHELDLAAYVSRVP